MNVWKLTATNNLVHTTEDLVPLEGKRKIRITKVLLNRDDALLLSGARKTKFPRIPGRFAVGQIMDEGSTHFPRGARVLLHSVIPTRYDGAEKRNFDEDDYLIRGQTADGFLRDFIYASEDEIDLLPDSVTDENALLVHHVATATAAIDALDIGKGEHIAVLGGSVLGLFVCQLLIYRQSAPILIDSDPDRLDFAKSLGIYYTALDNETLLDRVGTLTGGRLADGVICIVTGETDNHNDTALKVCASDCNAVFCGQLHNSLSLDLSAILRKRISVHGITFGSEYIERSINLIANKAVDLSSFHANVLPSDQVERILREFLQNPVRPANELNVIDLLQ